MTKPVPGVGDVEITLLDETRILKPSLRAIQEVSRLADGVGGAIQSVQKQDFNTIAVVIALGLGLTENGLRDFKEKKGMSLEEGIYQTGVLSFSGPCVKYLTILANGGKPLETGGEAGEDASENPKDQ